MSQPPALEKQRNEQVTKQLIVCRRKKHLLIHELRLLIFTVSGTGKTGGINVLPQGDRLCNCTKSGLLQIAVREGEISHFSLIRDAAAKGL